MIRKIIFLLILAIGFLMPTTGTAQSKQKSEKQFLKELDAVLKKSSRHNSGYEGVMTIDSSFAISKEGILSVTVRYTTDTSVKRVRITAPVRGIQLVRYDLYLILEYGEDVVTVFESDKGSEFKAVYHSDWFNVGSPMPEDVIYQEKVQKALEGLYRFYK
jgi:hypothetical protein